MAANRNPIDIEALRIDPADPTLVPRGADKTRKKNWERKFVRVPWVWLDRLKATRHAAVYQVALLLIYEHWRTGGRPVRLSNAMLAEIGVTRMQKSRALDELEQLGLIEVKRGTRAARMLATSSSMRSIGAQIRKASCTGAQTSMPRSVARQAAIRIISAPLACIGKFRSDADWISPT